MIVTDPLLGGRPADLRKHFGGNGERADRHNRQDEQIARGHEMRQILTLRLQLHILGKCGDSYGDAMRVMMSRRHALIHNEMRGRRCTVSRCVGMRFGTCFFMGSFPSLTHLL